MTKPQTQSIEHIGETKGMADHDRDLIHELSKRLDAVWRYDQYIANAEGNEERREFWRMLKRQDIENTQKLRELIGLEIKAGCF